MLREILKKIFFDKNGKVVFVICLNGNVESVQGGRSGIDIQGNVGNASSNQAGIKAKNVFGYVKTNQGNVFCDFVRKSVQSKQGKVLQKEVSNLDVEDCVFEDEFISNGCISDEAVLKVEFDGEIKEFKVSSVKIYENSLILNSDLKIEFDGEKEIVVCIEGDLEELVIDCGKLNVTGSVKNVTINQGSIVIKGDVAGDVKTNQGDLKCQKVLGSICTQQGNIECGCPVKK